MAPFEGFDVVAAGEFVAPPFWFISDTYAQRRRLTDFVAST